MEGIDLLKIKFDIGEPLKPFDQLMGVLSPLSSTALPEPYRKLMLDEDSNITDFYPSEFVVDLKGKRFAWLGEVLLPFIEEERLLKAISPCEQLLTLEEKERNRKGETNLFVSKENSFVDTLNQKKNHESLVASDGKIKIDYEEFKLGGFIIEKGQNLDDQYQYFAYIEPENKVYFNLFLIN